MADLVRRRVATLATLTRRWLWSAHRAPYDRRAAAAKALAEAAAPLWQSLGDGQKRRFA
jgi:hypothetical protein